MAQRKEAYQLRGSEWRASQTVLNSSSVRVLASLTPGVARGAAAKVVDIPADALIELELTDGQVLWMRGDDYRARFGGGGARDGSGVFDLPSAIDPLPPGRQQARGAIQLGVRVLKVLGFDLEKQAALDIAKLAEERKGLHRPLGLGLWRCVGGTSHFDVQAPGKIVTDEASLVFLHGTGSSSFGSFGEFWSEPRSEELQRLQTVYGDRIFAFDHRSLSESPIQNAIDLVNALPVGMPLHLVSHSRGGLIGELLCRGQSKAPFSGQEFELAGNHAALLRELDKALRDRRPKVERFVRVACPALGTTLASGRLDRWLSVFGAVCGRALPETPLGSIFSDLSDFIAAVVKQRTNPDSLPGLEAMMPESPFIRVVNWQMAEAAGDLSVVAGDIDPSSIFAKTLTWVLDRFYDGDNDLVVNTPSMYGGSPRAGAARVSFHKGAEVNHFNYFKNEESATRIVAALADSGEIVGFQPLMRPVQPIARSVQRQSGKPQPTVFVLPGIMGSELDVNNQRVWLNIPSLVLGGMSKLGIGAANVKAVEMLWLYYSRLVDYLADTHKVIPFPFDWRLPVAQEAARLAKAVREELDAARELKQPVRFVCHSMGGLVARTMAAQDGALWRELCDQPGMRFVMLGTPNGGSHAITELLTGRSSTLKMLSLADFKHGKQDLLQVISQFPGVLSMLPRDTQDYFDAAVWARLHAADSDNGSWVAPSASDLANARKFRALMDAAPADPQKMIYVAGVADATVVGLKVEDGRIQFEATSRGDGTVPWDHGILPGLPTYYMQANHGGLVTHQEGFAAISELLDTGRTALLPQEAPVSRAAEARFPMPAPVDDLYPDRDVLAAAALGGRVGVAARPPAEVPPSVSVEVLWGDLQYANHYVAVGHYTGDVIVSAEGYLDGILGGVLTHRHRLGLYPGPIGTNAVFPQTNTLGRLQGGVVVGLGAVGFLTASQLTQSFRRAMLEYAFVTFSRDNTIRNLGISALLIGANAGGIPISDSLHAILQGVHEANLELDAAKLGVRISAVEFIELYEDRAIQAARVLAEMRDGWVFHGKVKQADGGLRRVSFEEPPGWWQRLQIHGSDEDDEMCETALRFTSVTRRARNEKRTELTQRALVDSFIEQSIRTTQDNRNVAQTLFELLLPNELKDQAPDQDNLILMLDAGAARYPWELLEDPSRRDGPLAVRHGLIRQLETDTPRENPRGSTKNTALVIGDPLSSFPELKGAQEEARAVEGALHEGDAGMSVAALIRPATDQVITALYQGPYKVLHLAGHGVYQYVPETGSSWEGKLGPNDTPFTGMVIGDGIVLSPGEVQHMRTIPELVFINCCHLGRIEQTGANANQHRQQNRLAANVAAEFIDMGVQAVVAAGWAVDDQAATTFAQEFYRAMLAGHTFGKAVLEARSATYQRHGGTNTWGAYQCYGDPDYALVRADDGGQAGSQRWTFVSPSEALAEVTNIAAKARNRDDSTSLLLELQGAEAVIKDNGWDKRGDMAAALGGAYAQTGQRAKAIGYYQQAKQAEDAGSTLHDLEQLANQAIRQTAEQYTAGKAAKRATLGEMDRWIKQLQDWNKQFGVSAERLCLLGLAWKRRAKISSSTADLRKMTHAYRDAFQYKEKLNGFDAYPLLNWVGGAIAGDWAGLKSTRELAVANLLERGMRELKTGPDISAWDKLMVVDFELLRRLTSSHWKAADFVSDFTARYREAGTGAGPGAFESVVENLGFLEQFATGSKKRALHDLQEALPRKA